nr:immunoglobulin heavy chain junction region [Macaca mulatta]
CARPHVYNDDGYGFEYGLESW